MGSTQQTSNMYSIFCRSEQKCICVHFIVFYVYFCVLRVNIGGFDSFLSIRSICAYLRSQKYKFQTKLDIETFRSSVFWYENVHSGVKSKKLSLCGPWSHQNDFYENRKILKFKIENKKSIWSKHVFWCVIQVCHPNIKNTKIEWVVQSNVFVILVQKVTKCSILQSVQHRQRLSTQ